ncbi:hypothetical protein VNO77_10219 [Canavalia gladiata]|uniref:Uncharacterized protein n=1 Tax=Canavalia gladiata TaxID=3824 RepID=A0AAN9QXG4_CANGL
MSGLNLSESGTDVVYQSIKVTTQVWAIPGLVPELEIWLAVASGPKSGFSFWSRRITSSFLNLIREKTFIRLAEGPLLEKLKIKDQELPLVWLTIEMSPVMIVGSMLGHTLGYALAKYWMNQPQNWLRAGNDLVDTGSRRACRSYDLCQNPLKIDAVIFSWKYSAPEVKNKGSVYGLPYPWRMSCKSEYCKSWAINDIKSWLIRREALELSLCWLSDLMTYSGLCLPCLESNFKSGFESMVSEFRKSIPPCMQY